jgi:hypothetical protein
MSRIKYIAFYDTPISKFKRVYSPAATSKMDYIVASINEIGKDVTIVSPSWYDHTVDKVPFHFQKKLFLNANKNLILAPSFGGNSKIARYSKIILSLVWLFFWLLFHVQKNEKIMVYHSIWITIPILLAKKIKGFKIILEVEEIYADVMTLHPFFDKWEQKMIFRSDFFIFSTDLLKDKLCSSKPYIILYGSYFVENNINKPPDDGKVHLLYAGIIDQSKRGAFNAVAAAKHLSGEYILHIIGFGDIENLLSIIEIQNSMADCKVYFHGTKNGADFIKFCQSCHIGLSTQKMEGSYLESSFPSKILSYLGMGLKVVSCAVSCVEKSKIGGEVSYYFVDDPIYISKAIVDCTKKSFSNSRDLLSSLHNNFKLDLQRFLD